MLWTFVVIFYKNQPDNTDGMLVMMLLENSIINRNIQGPANNKVKNVMTSLGIKLSVCSLIWVAA